MKKFSFCTTCGNRLSQLKATFESNLALIAANDEFEWVLVNFNSQDGLHGFIMDKLDALPGNFVYARNSADRPWHMAYSKNVAHRAAQGDFLINLDCDNFIGRAIEVAQLAVMRGERALHLWSGVPGDGTCGRIAVARDIFHALGGYNESFYPVGHEDLDLIKRIRKFGVPVGHYPCGERMAIANTKEEGIRFSAVGGLSWSDCRDRNKAMSNASIAKGEIVANAATGWGKAQLEVFHPQRMEIRT